jgi:hypothetical protein
MKRMPLAILLLGVSAAAGGASDTRPPIIDVHLHAYGAREWSHSGPNPVTGRPAPATAEAHMRATLAAMERYNIVLGIVSGPLDAVGRWKAAAGPGKILGSPEFGRPDMDFWGYPLPAMDALRTLFTGGQLGAMAEVTAQYAGLSPSDPALDPYFRLAEELDIPVGIHTGTSFPGTPYECCPKFRVALGNPLLLEDLLVRHPKLRIYIMHGGEPWRRETIALLQMYPQVYMDVAVINWIGGPKSIPEFHAFLKEMLAQGFGKRLMFGTDQMRWPEAIGAAIDAVESASFLSREQKRDVMYNNAARFLRLGGGSPGP